MKQNISTLQMIALLYNAIVPTAILVIPNVVMTHSEQDAWISILGAIAVGMVLAVILGSISAKNPGMPFPSLISSRFGRIAGVVAGLILTEYYISITAVILEEFTNILTDQILLETPSLVMMILIMTVVCYAVHQGIEVIARITGVVTTITITIYSLSFLMFINMIDIHQFQPVLNHSFTKIAYGGLLPMGWISEIAIVLILAPYLKNSRMAGKAALWGTVLAGFHLAITVALGIAVFGPDLPEQFRYPSFTMIEVVRLGTALERLDIIFVAFWISTIYIKLSLFLFGAFHCLTDTLKVKPSRPLLFALALFIIMTAAISFKDQGTFDMQNQHVTPYELLFTNVVLPLLIWAGLMVFRKHTPKRGN